MIYVAQLSIAASTLPTSPTIEDLCVTRGLVYKLEVQFPSGCQGLVGVSIYDGAYQVWPSTPDKWFV